MKIEYWKMILFQYGDFYGTVIYTSVLGDRGNCICGKSNVFRYRTKKAELNSAFLLCLKTENTRKRISKNIKYVI